MKNLILIVVSLLVIFGTLLIINFAKQQKEKKSVWQAITPEEQALFEYNLKEFDNTKILEETIQEYMSGRPDSDYLGKKLSIEFLPPGTITYSLEGKRYRGELENGIIVFTKKIQGGKAIYLKKGFITKLCVSEEMKPLCEIKIEKFSKEKKYSWKEFKPIIENYIVSAVAYLESGRRLGISNYQEFLDDEENQEKYKYGFSESPTYKAVVKDNRTKETFIVLLNSKKQLWKKRK